MLPCRGHRLQAIDPRPHLLNRLRGQQFTGTHTITLVSESSPYTPFASTDQTPRLSALRCYSHSSTRLRNSSAHLRNSSGAERHAMDRPLLSLFLRHAPCFSVGLRVAAQAALHSPRLSSLLGYQRRWPASADLVGTLHHTPEHRGTCFFRLRNPLSIPSRRLRLPPPGTRKHSAHT